MVSSLLSFRRRVKTFLFRQAFTLFRWIIFRAADGVYVVGELLLTDFVFDAAWSLNVSSL